MEELIDRLNKFLASTYVIYLKSHFFHWNVRGSDFPMYHAFLGDFYAEIYGSVDDIAEHIRQLDGIPFNSPSMIRQNSYISEASNNVPVSIEMFNELLADVQQVSKDLVDINRISDRFSEIGLSNFLQDRHAAFRKHAWMLKSIVAKVPE